jgi:hypothetical protein
MSVMKGSPAAAAAWGMKEGASDAAGADDCAEARASAAACSADSSFREQPADATKASTTAAVTADRAVIVPRCMMILLASGLRCLCEA